MHLRLTPYVGIVCVQNAGPLVLGTANLPVRETSLGREEEGRGGEGEEEMFFDAHEISAEEWAKTTRSEFMSQTSAESGRDAGAAVGDDNSRPPFNGRPMEEVGGSSTYSC